MIFLHRLQGDLQPNLSQTRPSLQQPLVDIQTRKAPRRSERLSLARGMTTETINATESSTSASDPIDFPQGAKRVRSKSEPSNSKPTLKSTETLVEIRPSTMTTKARKISRPSSMDDIPPQNLQVTRKASLTHSDDSNAAPAKRSRHFSLVNRKQVEAHSQEHHNLLIANFEPTKYTSGFSPYDGSIRGDVLQSPEYVSDIFQRLYHSEVSLLR
jgi:hypothetical protein